MHLNHLTLTSGHCRRSARSEVSDEVLAELAPWLTGCTNSTALHPLPVPELAHLSARVTLHLDCLLVTAFAPAGPHVPGTVSRGKDLPLLTFGVVQREEQSDMLWSQMVSIFGAADSARQPPAPWIAVALHPGALRYPELLPLFADFERCCAWAWITRNPALQRLRT